MLLGPGQGSLVQRPGLETLIDITSETDGGRTTRVALLAEGLPAVLVEKGQLVEIDINEPSFFEYPRSSSASCLVLVPNRGRDESTGESATSMSMVFAGDRMVINWLMTTA